MRKDWSALAALTFALALAADAGAAQTIRGLEGLPDTAANQRLSKCVRERIAEAEPRAFEGAEGGARCPGGGCLFQSSSCNRREGVVSYRAPEGYLIASYRHETTAQNDGVTASGDKVERNSDNEIVAVEKMLVCDPSDRPGAGGGWHYGRFVGELRLTKARRTQLEADFALSCRSE